MIMGKWKIKLQKLMMGRYGMDSLNYFLFQLCMGLMILTIFIDSKFLLVLSAVFFVLWNYRAFSKDIQQRRKEERWYTRKTLSVYRHGLCIMNQIKDPNRRYFVCPRCRTINRVPKGKGKISIHCPQCGENFERKT